MPLLGPQAPWTSTSPGGVVSCRTGPALGALGFDLSSLLDLAKLSLETWKSVSAVQLQREALKLQARGVELQRAVALEQLAVLKAQLDPTPSATVATYAPWALALAVLALGWRLLR